MKSPQGVESIEREQILAQFVETFDHLRQVPLVLYGIGANTHYLLKRLTGFHIVGLMDQENTGREIYGLPVLSPEQVARLAKAIVIVARPAVVLIIHARIAGLAADHGVKIYDLAGNDMSASRQRASDGPRRNHGPGEAELREAIDGANVVSFDIFDTLVMRKVLRAENVFDVVERSLPRELGLCVPFKTQRILAEQQANEKRSAPTIGQIYEELARLLGLTKAHSQKLLEHEIAVEARLLCPRDKTIALFRYALERGKTVFLVSDMYLGRDVLSRLIAACGIEGYQELLVSCEVGRTKRSGELFQYLLELTPRGAHLHVGDDPVADVEAPSRLGIQTFQVASGYEMLVSSPFSSLLTRVSCCSDALALGLFVAHAFNDPFALHATGGRLAIRNDFDLGYLIYGAVLTGFVHWILGEASGQGQSRILFGSRDGYLVKRLYERFIEVFGLTDMP
jgi:FMN phosphatase YigB (HAD superfamily)